MATDRVCKIFAKHALPAGDDVLFLPRTVVPHDSTVPAVGHVPHSVPLVGHFLSFPNWKQRYSSALSQNWLAVSPVSVTMEAPFSVVVNLSVSEDLRMRGTAKLGTPSE